MTDEELKAAFRNGDAKFAFMAEEYTYKEVFHALHDVVQKAGLEVSDQALNRIVLWLSHQPVGIKITSIDEV